MTQTTNRFFDELAKMATDAAGAAHGVRKEVETAFRGQVERILNDFEVVQRDEFDAVKAMAQKAREENERLAARVAELEELLAYALSDDKASTTPRPIRKQKPKPGF